MSWIRLMDSNGAEVSVNISPGSVVFAFNQDACEEGCHTHPDRAAEFFREGLRRLEGSANEGERMAQALADAGPDGPPEWGNDERDNTERRLLTLERDTSRVAVLIAEIEDKAERQHLAHVASRKRIDALAGATKDLRKLAEELGEHR